MTKDASPEFKRCCIVPIIFTPFFQTISYTRQINTFKLKLLQKRGNYEYK